MRKATNPLTNSNNKKKRANEKIFSPPLRHSSDLSFLPFTGLPIKLTIMFPAENGVKNEKIVALNFEFLIRRT